MQLVSARIWTRVAESISYDSNHYTTGTSSNIGINSNEGVFHIPQSSRIGTLTSDAVLCHISVSC